MWIIILNLVKAFIPDALIRILPDHINWKLIFKIASITWIIVVGTYVIYNPEPTYDQIIQRYEEQKVLDEYFQREVCDQLIQKKHFDWEKDMTQEEWDAFKDYMGCEKKGVEPP
jgi:hypothetical protein